MILIGYLFVVALVGSTILVALNRMAEGLLVKCRHCGRNRIRRDRCGHCGVMGNPAPEPNPKKKNSRSTRVHFE